MPMPVRTALLLRLLLALVAGAAGNSTEACTLSTLDGYTCVLQDIGSSGLRLHWHRDGDGTLRLAAEVDALGYLSLGWSPNGGAMLGSTVVVGTDVVGVYELGGYASDDVVPSDAPFELGNASIERDAGKTTLRFTRALSEVAGKQSMVYAFGDTVALDYHGIDRRGSFIMDFETAEATVVARGGTKADHEVHGVVMFLGLTVAFPVGVIVARYGKARAYWYNAHRIIQVCGLLLALIGFILALSKFDSSTTLLHRKVGFAVMFGAILQPIATIVHPEPSSKYRTAWATTHHFVGRAVLIAAVWNVWLGIKRFDLLYGESPDIGILFWTWVVAIVLVAWTLESIQSRALANRLALLEEKTMTPRQP